ncbi:MAG: M28 family peptidase [Candidatus Lokiarchaeota archaeon]|nr:M28 family peptidase [Candidatus Lokiarchaeota archaeon]
MTKRKNEASFMLNFIKEICQEVGPRPYFTEKEAEGANYVKERFRNYVEDVQMERFFVKEAPTIFSFKVAVILYVISTIFYIFVPLISLILMVFNVIMLLLEEIWVIKIFNPLFSRQKTQNVIAKVKPIDQAKKIVIFGSHIDSTYEFPLFRIFKNKVIIIISLGLLFMFIHIIFSVIKLVLGGFRFIFYNFNVMTIILMVGIGFVLPFYFMVSNRPVYGANDNLSAVAVCLNLLRKFSKTPPKNIELWFCAFGAEETGRVGSSQFVNKHKNEIRNSYTINLESIGGEGKFHIVKKEITISHSEEVIDILQTAANNISHPMDLYSIPISGGTDSWSFSKKGLKATSIICQSDTLIPEGWHTREDTPDIIDKEHLKIISDVCSEFIRLIDDKDWKETS